MIVTCTGCRTRFRVADEKVGPKGARLRCTRCKAVFSVPGPGEIAPASPTPSPATPPPATPVPAITPSALPQDPFATRPDDPFFAAAVSAEAPAQPPPPPPAPADDDPFALASFPDEPSAGNSAVAEVRLQAPAPGIAAVATSAPYVTPPEVAEPSPAEPAVSQEMGLALEESDRRVPPAAPAAFAEPTPPPTAPGLLDFGSFDFGDPADEPPPPPVAAATPAPVHDGEVDPLAGLSVDDLDRHSPPVFAPVEAPAPEVGKTPVGGTPLPAAPSIARETGIEARQAERPSRRPLRLGAVGVNALSLAALVIVAAAMFSSWRDRSGGFAGGAATPLAARATSSGLYDTAGGRPVLVVRGDVRSRAAEPVAARVRVELLDGGRVVAQAVGAPGAVPTPEEAWAVDGAPAAAKLAAELAARGVPRLAPGESAPFGVVLADVPPGAERLTLRVTANP